VLLERGSLRCNEVEFEVRHHCRHYGPGQSGGKCQQGPVDEALTVRRFMSRPAVPGMMPSASL
jgi:hypothetical protein